MARAGTRQARPDSAARLRLRVRGAVQGVGFRPFAQRIAARYGLTGFVQNDANGVLLEIEGAQCGAFLAALEAEAPPLANIESVDVEQIDARGDCAFSILQSAGGKTKTRIVADAATCPDCLEELFDASSRFHLYPFLTCTHCGPRFTIASSLPYDRARTSMANFPLCPRCEADYHDPHSRRFHAEAIACPACGPRLDADVSTIVEALRQGAVVALKGIGGYHLMCDARNEGAVASLRQRKARDAKPFAVMAANLASIDRIAAPTPAERALLAHRATPIVLMRSTDALAPSVAPGLGRIGVMLPYAPLHHLLFHAAAGYPSSNDWRGAAQGFVLVATSANRGGEPLVVDDHDARRRLSGIADLIVGHDRAIVARVDDSVMRIVDGAPAFLRRARGFVPDPVDLKTEGPCVVAVGGHLKSTVTVARGREAFISPHIGDLDDAESIRFFEESLRRLLSLLDVEPDVAACDLHPDFFSTRFAEETNLPLQRVQHHAAHVGAIAAEHGVDGPLLGVALDGYGMGDDGGAWGGELILLDGARWTRLGHLAPLPLPGGDRAAREPWRMGVAALAATGRLHRARNLFPDAPLAGQLAERLRRDAEPTTTSMGRLFDAAAALAGVCREQRYEGQAAMELEALVRTPRHMAESFQLSGGVLDFSPLLAFLADERPGPREAAEYFHGALIEGCAAWIEQEARARGLARIALGGGCMMNMILAEGLSDALRARGLSPMLARAAPCNDGGLSLGQAAIARAAFETGGVRKENAACV
ncbi:carbamoyltransferase HypF [Methylocystis echinoides]|uniref:carbamoyltransferase HypF n=1 Tax=Methylocystis echinoides TaxID=29468 RepID=UPI00342B59E2